MLLHNLITYKVAQLLNRGFSSTSPIHIYYRGARRESHRVKLADFDLTPRNEKSSDFCRGVPQRETCRKRVPEHGRET